MGISMNLSVSYAMNQADTTAAVDGLRRLEVMRVIPGYVVGFLCVLVCLAVHSPLGAEICGFVILVLAVLTVHWLRIVAKVRKTAPASMLPTVVSISDQGLAVSRAGSAADLSRWKDFIHCTNTVNTWIFARKGGKDAILIPQLQLDPMQRDQVGRLLATWPKRRYRTTPW